jgi:SAM-dependent methyltransferase
MATDKAQHYRLEKQVAGRLRESSAEERAALYKWAYDTIYSSVPGLREEALGKSAADTAKEVALLKRFIRPGDTYLEVGPGNCGTALQICEVASEVIAVDVSEELVRSIKPPSNFTFCLSDGVTIPLESETVDVAFSNQLMEHLHPVDASEQVKNIYNVLKTGGQYVCITPNRLTGPHDVSRSFDETATGLHLKEYTYGELDELLRSVGFRKTQLFVGLPPLVLQSGISVMRPVEWVLSILPVRLRKLLTFNRVASHLMGIRLVATK